MSYLARKSFDEIESAQHRSELVSFMLGLAFVLTILTGLL
jgi:hypothetical protein